jgi:iron complex transport system ATP-binding protein
MPALLPIGAIAVDARAVSVELGGVRVVSDVSVTVRAGEVVALVGPNGAGKSTLLAAISGDVPTVGGSIELFGAPLHAWSTIELAMRRSVLLQSVQVSFPFTVLEVARMGRAPWARTPAEDGDDSAVADALATADVVEFADRSFSSLSGGERARAALARVLAQRAQLLLLDEPTAALDLHHQEHVMSVARARARAGDAVVVVVHDLTLGAAYADRVVVLSHGSVAADGPPADVLTADLLSIVYDHDVEVLAHPRTGLPLVLPNRA